MSTSFTDHTGVCERIRPPFAMRLEAPGDDAAIEALHHEAFGPGRFARTAFRIREGVAQDARLCFVAENGRSLVGSVRVTPILIGETPAELLGPLTVAPACKNGGIGRALLSRTLEAAAACGENLILLVGDYPYYGPHGFKPVPAGRITLPGPVDPARLLLAELTQAAGEGVAGRVHARQRIAGDGRDRTWAAE